MNIFDKEFIKSLAREITRPILEAIQDFIKRQDNNEHSQTGLIPQDVVLKELDIDWGTLKTWRKKGLKKLEKSITTKTRYANSYH